MTRRLLLLCVFCCGADYSGHPEIKNLRSIEPRITCLRAAGARPFVLHVSAEQTTFNDGQARTDGESFELLDFRWEFGQPGRRSLVNHRTGVTYDANQQTGPLACFVYDDAGSYTVKLTVRGRRPDGSEVTATTTRLVRLAEYEVFPGNATGGAYTLTVNGETTAPIPFNANGSRIASALGALPAVGPRNVRFCGYGHHTQGNFEFVNNLAGKRVKISADFSQLVGAKKPQLIERFSPSVSEAVHVGALRGWRAMYFDSNSPGGNGTSRRPSNSATELARWLSGREDNRVAYIARGSDFTMTSRIEMEGHMTGRRILAYGDGAKPILRSRLAFIRPESVHMSPYVKYQMWGDIVMASLDLRASGEEAIIRSRSSNNGRKENPHSSIAGLATIDCDFTRLGTGTEGAFLCRAINSSYGMCLWNCNIDQRGIDHYAAVSFNTCQWAAVVGGSVGGVAGSVILNHPIYPNVLKNQLYKSIEFTDSPEANMCINTNAANRTANRFVLIDKNWVKGTANGLDFSAGTNGYVGDPQRGYFRDVVVSGNRFRPGIAASGQRNGVVGYNIEAITVRDNLFENAANAIYFKDVTKDLVQRIYRNEIEGGIRVAVLQRSHGYFKHNVCKTEQACLSFVSALGDIATWDIDHNTYTTKAESPWIRDGVLITEDQWHAWGHDTQ